VRKEIREMVIFAPQNLIMDPPFTKLDILSCRNLLIYLTTGGAEETDSAVSLQPQSRRHFVSRQRGDDGDFTDLFAPLSGKSRLFRRTESVLRPEQIEFPSSFTAGPPVISEARPATKPPASLQSLADQLVLQSYAPPAVLTNDKGDIFYVSGRTGKYLEPAAGKANWNILPWPAKGCATNWRTPSRKRSGKKEGVTAARTQGRDQRRHAVRGCDRPAAR
jgi:two-component system CheB/CheR fusion protein